MVSFFITERYFCKFQPAIPYRVLFRLWDFSHFAPLIQAVDRWLWWFCDGYHELDNHQNDSKWWFQNDNHQNWITIKMYLPFFGDFTIKVPCFWNPILGVVPHWMSHWTVAGQHTTKRKKKRYIRFDIRCDKGLDKRLDIWWYIREHVHMCIYIYMYDSI